VTASVIVQETTNASMRFSLRLAFRGILYFDMSLPRDEVPEQYFLPPAVSRFPCIRAIDTVAWFKNLMPLKSMPFKITKNKAGMEFVETRIGGVFSGTMGVNYVVDTNQVNLDTGRRTRGRQYF
jgi:hypothetical protein